MGQVLGEAESIHAPALCDLEIASVLRRGMLTGRLTAERAGAALAALLDLPIIRHTHEPLLSRVLALRENFTAYDASYVALAQALGCSLLTTDQRLTRSVASLHAGTLVELPE